MSPLAPVRVRLTPAVAVRVAMTALGTVVLLLALDRSRTVLHWLVTAGAAALLLDGPVRALADRRVHRGVAVALVTTATLLGAALLTYGVVDAVVDQYQHLRSTAPGAVADVVRTGPLRGLGERLDLVQRTSDLVDTAPQRLFGSPASAARTAAGRLGEVALVLTLTVFMLVAYERFEQRLLRLQAEGRSWRWSGIDAGVAEGARSARHLVAGAVVAGVLTAVVAQAVDLPAPVALGLWTAWWRLLPVLGIVVGYVPLVLLLLTDVPRAVAVAALLLLAAAEAVARVAERRLLGPPPLPVPMSFAAAVAFLAGMETGGVAGAVVLVVLAHLGAGVLQHTAQHRPVPAPVGAAPQHR